MFPTKTDVVTFSVYQGRYTNESAYPITDSLENITTYAFKHSLNQYNWDLFLQVPSSNYTVGDAITIKVWLMLGTATNWCLSVNNGAGTQIRGVSYDASHGLNTSTYTQVSFSFITPTLAPNCAFLT